jgi:hypothetical protein
MPLLFEEIGNRHVKPVCALTVHFQCALDGYSLNSPGLDVELTTVSVVD